MLGVVVPDMGKTLIRIYGGKDTFTFERSGWDEVEMGVRFSDAASGTSVTI